MGATRSLLDDDEPGQAITATQAAQAECEAGLNDPLRRYKLWRPVSALQPRSDISCEASKYKGFRAWLVFNACNTLGGHGT